MSEETIGTNSSVEDNRASQESEISMHWGVSAPKGGRTVLNRILKDGAKVPLFLGQTLVSAPPFCESPGEDSLESFLDND